LFSTLAGGDPFQIYGKALLILKLVFQADDDKDLVILACTVLTDPPVWQTDRQTDRQTDERTNRIATAKTHYSSSCYCM